jgi:hypothetical protein
LGCFLAVGILELVEHGGELLGQGDGFYRANGYFVVGALVVILAWPLIAWRMAPAGEGAVRSSS